MADVVARVTPIISASCWRVVTSPATLLAFSPPFRPFLCYWLHELTPSFMVGRVGGFLIREASICLERPSIRAGLFLADTRFCIRPGAIREAPR
jgi:hypothetical protein